MFSRLATREGGAQITAAMQAHPRLVGGDGRPDTDLMETLPGWTAKGGAEGLLCVAGPDGVGIALKSADGSLRPLRAALPVLLARIGVELDAGFGASPVRNSRGEAVGELLAER